MSIGERLKRARRRKKISLDELEEITKIRKRYLEDIERNNFDNLPSPVYARGFLFKYASAVGVDPQEILDLFNQVKTLEMDFSKNPAQPVPPKVVNYPKILITPKLIITLIVGMLFLGFIVYIFTQVRNFAKAPELIVTSPASDKLSINSSSLKIEGKASPGASVFINDQPINVELDGNFSEEVRLKDGINEIKVSAKNKTNKETAKIFDVAVKLPTLASQTPTVLGSKSLELVLKIQVGPNPAWLSVNADGKTVFQGVMLKDTFQEFRAEREIIINTGNAGSTHVFLQNEDWGVLGKEGEVKKGIKYTIDMVK